MKKRYAAAIYVLCKQFDCSGAVFADVSEAYAIEWAREIVRSRGKYTMRPEHADYLTGVRSRLP